VECDDLRSPIRIAAFVVAVLFLTASAASIAGEDTFIFVDKLPDIRGDHQRKLTAKDEQNGLRIDQDVYAEDFDHAWIQTFVMAARCLDEKAEAATRAYIVAIKYPPKKPATFAIAGLHDIYKEVYVEDRSGRIRLYEDVPAQSMLEIFDRFKPVCVRT
jgi:hypothetical protein